jgi:hypothetical protein
MVVAVMQPYFFPYIGYFQLMAACDVFVVLDDVQYIRGGWVNRNRILVNGGPQWITMPVAKADRHHAINKRNYLPDDRLARRLRPRIVGAYRGAPFFDDTMQVVDAVLGCGEANVAAFNTHLLRCVARRLGVDTPVRLASAISRPESLGGQEMVLDLCKRLGASSYVNPIGGLQLYDPARFSQESLTLRFLRSCAPAYPQFRAAPVQALSIIDVMMFNDIEAVRHMLEAYRLLQGHGDMAPRTDMEAPLS